MDWCAANLGCGHMEQLREKHHQIKKWKQWEKDEMYQHYKKELARVREIRATGDFYPIDVVSYQ